MLTAAHFCRIAGEKQTKQLERKEKKRIARRQRSSKAEIEVTRLTPTPIVGFKKFFLSFAFFIIFYLFLIWGGEILSLKLFFFPRLWLKRRRQADKKALVISKL